MKQLNYKKLILPNIPYVFFVYLFDKVGQAVRLAPGADISEKILNITQGFSDHHLITYIINDARSGEFDDCPVM